MKKPINEWVWKEEDAWTHNPQVFADLDPQPKWSGLYDADGRKLYRMPLPFGFRRK